MFEKGRGIVFFESVVNTKTNKTVRMRSLFQMMLLFHFFKCHSLLIGYYINAFYNIVTFFEVNIKK